MSIITRMFGKPDQATIPYPLSSIEGLVARWVQWGASSREEVNPIADETGQYAHLHQPEDVWFLAGCFGGSVNRRCTIPSNRKILVPVFNMWFTEHYEPPDLSEAHGFMKLNGEEIELHKVLTEKPFIIKGVWGNPVTGSFLEHKMRIGGLWKVLDPLPVGTHDLYFRGDDGGGFYVEAMYQIEVTP